jgi:hypothetical protein
VEFVFFGLISLGFLVLLISGALETCARCVLMTFLDTLRDNCPWIGYRLALRTQRRAKEGTIAAMLYLRENSEMPRIIRISGRGVTKK